MSIKKTVRSNNTMRQRRPITAGTHVGSRSVASGAINRNAKRSSIMAATANLTPVQRQFVAQLSHNVKKQAAIMGATNTSNIAARPEFLELLPMFVQKLLILDVFGSVAMKSRQQLIPYFKFVAENTKGETQRGTIMSSPMVNRQGMDPNFGGRFVKNEVVESAAGTFESGNLAYIPVLPGSVTVQTTIGGVTTSYIDDGEGNLLDNTGAAFGTISYSDGAIAVDGALTINAGDSVKASYEYDNETIGPDADGNYGARMAKGSLQLDEFNMIAEAHELACYWSIYAAFAAQTEYGANINDLAKESAFSELTAEINTKGFQTLENAAKYKPQYNWDASPVLSGSVVPSDYINMFKLKLTQAAASVYQTTRLSRPNTLVVGSNVASYLQMIDGFQSAGDSDSVGPYKLGKLDAFNIFVEPAYDPNKWVMSCKHSDIRRNSALFGEYMPMTSTDAVGLANASTQQGYVTMYAMKVVNPETVVSGKILGVY